MHSKRPTASSDHTTGDDETTPRDPVRTVNIEKLISTHVSVRGADGFTVTSEGMNTLGKPELIMQVKEGYFLAAACRIMNDVARYIVMYDRNPTDGQRVQVAPWTTIQFKRIPGRTGGMHALLLEDGTGLEFFE